MTLKDLIFSASRVCNLNAALKRSAWRNSRLAILCYHGVSLDDEHQALPELYVTAGQLRQRFEFLQRGGYTVLPLREALERLWTRTLPQQSVALTFDDGTRDFAALAVPLLLEFGFPATVYVTTYYCDHAWPVFNTAMRYLLWYGSDSDLNLSDLFDQVVRLSKPGRPSWPTMLKAIEEVGWSAIDKQTMLKRTAARIGLDFDTFLAKGQFTIMTPAQLAALPPSLVDVQLHTHRHRTPRDRFLFEREIKDNISSLQSIIGTRPMTHFCYPSGDYTAAFIPWLEALGITSATTCVPGLASTKSCPLLLPRIFDSSLTSDAVFSASIDGIADFLPRKRAYRLDITKN